MAAREAFSRNITIPGTYNLRDVGGYTTRGGSRTRWRTLLRSSSPHWFPPQAWQALQEYGVRTMIDLRRPVEVGQDHYHASLPDSMRYAHLPLFDDEGYYLVDQPANDLAGLYGLMLEHCSTQFVGVVREIAADDEPSLVHCAIGKDRTGLVIALTLSAVGVDQATIAEDYAISSELLSPLYARFRAAVQTEGGDLERLERMLESRYETMIDTLALLDQRYGGVQNYLEVGGLEAKSLEALHRKLVE